LSSVALNFKTTIDKEEEEEEEEEEEVTTQRREGIEF
jgi:hypothetical protein